MPVVTQWEKITTFTRSRMFSVIPFYITNHMSCPCMYIYMYICIYIYATAKLPYEFFTWTVYESIPKYLIFFLCLNEIWFQEELIGCFPLNLKLFKNSLKVYKHSGTFKFILENPKGLQGVQEKQLRIMPLKDKL